MSKSAAVVLGPGVFRIPTQFRSAINSFALVDDDGSVTLIDCGVKKAPARIVAALAAIGKTPADVNRIVLTHVHPDHAGGAAEMSRLTGAPVLTHADDAEYARAGRPPISDPSFLSGRLFTRVVGRVGFPAFEVAASLRDGEILDVAGGVRVVHTPGHSPGHVSLLHEQTKTLITGDAIFNLRALRISPRLLCSDFRMTQQTAHVLGELEYGVAAFTHGPEIRNRARDQIRSMLSRIKAT